MADFMSPATRSRVMSKIRSRDTRPELYVRRNVWSSGYRYRLHVKTLPGVPDLVFHQYRIAVFVHGCFWHQHGCSLSHLPSSNKEYWESKLNKNRTRDEKNSKKLQRLGWNVKTIWECSLTEDTKRLINQLDKLRMLKNDPEPCIR